MEAMVIRGITMKKLSIYLSSILMLLLVFLSPALVKANEFSDVSRYHWAYQDIKFLSDKEVIKGHLGKFSPNASITRNDAAIMLVRAMNLETPAEPQVIPADMNPSTRGYNEVLAVLDKGMFSLTDNKFDPGKPLTRKDMAMALAVGFEYIGSGKSRFKDLPAHDPYYPFVDAIAENKVTTGYGDGTFKPDLTVDRLQFAVFLARIYTKPLEYNVKSSGEIKHTVRSAEEAINLAMQYPDGTVHPADNTLQSFSDHTGLLSETGIRNGVLIYNGAEQNTDFTANYFKPYLTPGGTNQTLFDTFIILGRSYPGGELGSSKNYANYSDFQWYIDQTFSENGVLEALNASSAQLQKKSNVYLAIPYPKLQEDIIGLDGAVLKNSPKERENMAAWYMEAVEDLWEERGFSNLTFKGYYWMSETMGYPQDGPLVEQLSARIHQKDKYLIYSPHALSTNFERWETYGFDGAYLQPNAFRLKLTDADQRLHRAFLNAQIYGSGINIEIDQYGPHQIEAGIVNFKKYIEMSHRYGLPGQSLIFYQGIGMVDRMIQYGTPYYMEAYEQLKSLSYSVMQ
jgi:hypothetical protein